jgi:DNA-directed RNA polymerase subunit N (RpoN/RPB10)
MPNCFRCGRPLTDTNTRLRRKVQTGEWVRRGYGKSKILGTQTSFGMRIVCKGCVQWLDSCEGRLARHQWVQLGLAFITLVLLVSGSG